MGRSVGTHCQVFRLFHSACTWVAAKMEDRSPPSMDDLVYISDRSFHTETLRQLEQRICRQLAFALHRVTPLHYLNQFLRASRSCSCASCLFDHPVLRKLVLYLLELSRVSFDLSYRPPSLVAAAAVYLARATLGLRETHPDRKLGTTGYWTRTLQYTTGYSLRDLEGTALLLHRYQLGSESSKTSASFIKYKKRNLMSVSCRTVPRVEDLDFDVPVRHDDFVFHPEPDVLV